MGLGELSRPHIPFSVLIGMWRSGSCAHRHKCTHGRIGTTREQKMAGILILAFLNLRDDKPDKVIE